MLRHAGDVLLRLVKKPHRFERDGDAVFDIGGCLVGFGLVRDALKGDHSGRVFAFAARAKPAFDGDQFPALQFLDARENIGARHVKRLGDLVCGRWRGASLQKRLDLRDGPVCAPRRAHLCPVENEVLHGGCEVHGLSAASHFCLN